MSAAEDATHDTVPRADRWTLVAILAVALALRLREAIRTPFWFDELFTLHVARDPTAERWRHLAGDIHPPLHTMLVVLWRAIGGENPLWLKTLPILIGLATVLLTWGFARQLFGRRAGLLAAGLLALHPMHVYFSQELRSYGLLAFALLVALWAAWRWLESGRARDAVLGVFGTALTLYTHYLGLLVLVVADVYVLVRMRPAHRRMRDWLLVHLGFCVLALPLSGLLPEQLVLSEHHWVHSTSLEALVTLARKCAFGAIYAVPVVAILALLPLLRDRERRGAAFVLWVTVVPVLLAFIATLFGAHLFSPRYMYFTLPGLCALLGAGIAGLRPPRLAAGIAALTIVFAARAALITRPLPEAVILRDVARELETRMRPGDLLFCADTHSLVVLDYHMGRPVGRLVLEHPTALPYYLGEAIVPNSRRVPFDSLAAAARAGRRWWAVRTKDGAASSVRMAARIDSLAGDGPRFLDPVTVWAGSPGMLGPEGFAGTVATHR